MAVTPNTVVHFLNVPLENNYKNQIYFTNRTNQTTYMLTKKVKTPDGDPLTFSNLTYQRKDSVIRVPVHIDQMINANYVMYQNTSYTNRWFYAFITKMEYVNDGRTDVHIETDVWQTWFDKITLKASFVEREHVEDDTCGLHTIPEGLETGEYICNEHLTDNKLDDVDGDLTYVIGTTSELKDGTAEETPAGSGVYNGIYSGVKYYTYEDDAGIDAVMKIMAENAKIDAITGVFMSPKFLAPRDTSEITGQENQLVKQSTAPYSYNVTQTKQLKLNGYSVKNMKLLCYPYNYLLVSNNNGGSAIYQYEHFTNQASLEFEVKGVLTPGCSIRMIPKNYKGAEKNDEEGINLGKYPICNYATDMYTNWLTQNSVNIALDYAKAGAKIVAGTGMVLMGGIGATAGVGSIYSGVVGVADTLAQKYEQSLVPPQARGNLNCGDVITADNKNTFHFYKMSIKKEYAEIIDNFFEMYGYKVNTVKVPKINTRPYWNYVKTINVNLDGQCPSEDLTKIRQMFDNGVTFWKDGDNVENYSLNNH